MFCFQEQERTIIGRAITVGRKRNQENKQRTNRLFFEKKVKKIKSNNFIGSNRENSNIAIIIL